jgi:predicted SAM-dependent methyltransferase
MIKRNLNLGSGYIEHPDWCAVDKQDYGHNIVADVLEGLPFPDELFKTVIMNHTLQMFHYDELPVVLKEVKRVMEKGAVLRILTPDLKKAIKKYTHGHSNGIPVDHTIEGTYNGRIFRYIFWHGDTKCGFDTRALTDVMTRNGFRSPRVAKFGECELDTREHESLIMEFRK